MVISIDNTEPNKVMPKNSKKSSKKTSSKDPTSETSATTSATTEPEVEEFKSSSGVFNFPNGDKYEGEFCAHISGVVWREGHGIYTSKDGQIYEAEWKDDKILETEPVKITFADGTKYYGSIYKHKYNGPGIYEFNTNMAVNCNFADNKPEGDVIFIDFEGKLWYGVADANPGVLLYKQNLFYSKLNENNGKGKSRMREKIEDQNQQQADTRISMQSEISVDFDVLEKQFFGKSNKTELDINYGDSPWYQNYVNFKSKLEIILSKKTNNEELTEEESDWYDKYLEFRKRFQDRMEKRKNIYKEINVDLLKRFFSEEFQRGSLPIKVVYPSESEYYDSESSTISDSSSDDVSDLPEDSVSSTKFTNKNCTGCDL